MKRIAICLALIGAMVPASGLAQSAAGSGDRPDADPDRYVLSPAGESFLRLDRQTGRISQCLKRDEAWRCVLVPRGARARGARMHCGGTSALTPPPRRSAQPDQLTSRRPRPR